MLKSFTNSCFYSLNSCGYIAVVSILLIGKLRNALTEETEKIIQLAESQKQKKNSGILLSSSFSPEVDQNPCKWFTKEKLLFAYLN